MDRAGGIRGPDLAAADERWRLAWPVHLATLAAAFLLLLRLNEGQWFIRDEWAFLVDRGGGGGDDRGLLEPHNEHWTTIPVLAYRALFAVFGARTYVPYVVVLIVVHLVAAHLLWRIMRRSGADAWIATSAIPVLLVFGPAADNLLWAFQITFIGSLAFGLGHVLVVDHDGPFDRRDVLGWALGVGALMCSGIGVPMVAAAGLAALRRGPGVAALTLAVPAAIFLVWFAVIGPSLSGSASPHLLLSYVGTGLWATLEGIARSAAAAAVLIAGGLAGVVLLSVRRRPVPVPALACAVGAVAMFVVTGLGRAGSGVEQATSPRYVYLGAALLLPLLATGLSVLGRLLPGLWLVPCVAAVLATGAVLVELGRKADAQAERDGFAREVVLAAARPGIVDGPILTDTPDPRNAPDLQLGELRDLARAGELPSTGSPTAEAALQVALGLQVRVVEGDPRAARGQAEVLVKGAEAVPAGGCLEIRPSAPRPRLEVRSGDGIGLRSPAGLTYTASRGGVTTPTPLLVPAGGVLVTLGLAEATVVFRWDPGAEVFVCGIPPAAA